MDFLQMLIKLHDIRNNFFFSISGMCKHIAALCYAIARICEKVKDDGLSCTEVLQTWHQPKGKKRDAAFLQVIKTPKAGKSMKVTDKPRRDQYDPRAPRDRFETKFDFDKLAEVSNGQAAVLMYIQRTEDHSRCVPDLNDTTHFETVISSEELNVPCVPEACLKAQSYHYDDVMHHLQCSENSVAWLSQKTEPQSSCDEWNQQRIGRITASNMGKVLNHVDDNLEITGKTHSLTATIMGYYKPPGDSSNGPRQWGLANEKNARTAYNTKMRQRHKKFTCNTTGLWIYQTKPCIAATPDGLCECTCCGKGCIEIKCPYKDRYKTIAQLAETKNSFIVTDSLGHHSINMNHEYYIQIQTQLLCTDRKYCDLVVLMKKFL